MIPLSRIHLIPSVKKQHVSKSVNVCRNLKSEFPIKILEENYHDSIYVSRHNGNTMYPAGFFVFSYVGNLPILNIQK